MAAATYTTDLTTLSTADATTSMAEPTGATAGGIPVAETDFFIQGAGCNSKTFNATAVGGIGYTAGAAVTIPTDGAVFVWAYFGAPNALTIKSSGGKQILLGESGAAYKKYYVSGSDTYTYGGWVCYPVSPTITASAVQGTSPTGTTVTMAGYAANVSNAVAKGNPFGLDAIRYGRGKITIAGGDLANGYGTFSACATSNNDIVANRWGIFSLVDGAYKMQGLLEFALTDFRDSNKTIVIQNTEFVTAGFNGFEVTSASANVQWTGISVSSLGTVSKGRFTVTANGTVGITGCTFTDMDSFTFLSNSTVTDTVFRRCGIVTSTGATISLNTFTSASGVTAVTTNNPATIQDCNFISSGTGHGVTITTPGTYTFSGNIFTGYGSAGTTNAAVYNNSGGAVTLNISGGGSVPTVRNGTSASTSVVASINLTLSGLKTGSEVRAYLGTDPATATAIDGTETSGTSFTFSHSVGGQAGYIQIFHVSYQPIILNLTYSGADSTIPIQQQIDRQYSNPA